MKAKANILMFGKVDSLGLKFPHFCTIDIPDKVPVLLNFIRNKVLGFAEVTRKRDCLEAEVTFFDASAESLVVQSLVKDGELFLTGYYGKADRKDDRILSCELHAVSIVYDDIYGDKSCLLREVTDESNNQD